MTSSTTSIPEESVEESVVLEVEQKQQSVGSEPVETVVSSGIKIESIQSRRATTSATDDKHKSITSSLQQQQQQIKLPTGPKNAASIATSISGTSGTSKRTMAYFLKDSGEGREMASSVANSSYKTPNASSAGSTTSESVTAPLSPSKTRRIVNLRNIKAPPRSSATSTALAPQVRVVDGSIVYDEKFAAAVSISSSSPTADILEEELEYVDEDDENGKHLTSATYSSKAKGSNRWNRPETDLFYEALGMCGTDFSMMQTLFPHRTRAQIKSKYKLEERANPARINTALKNKTDFDPTFKDRVIECESNSSSAKTNKKNKHWFLILSYYMSLNNIISETTQIWVYF